MICSTLLLLWFMDNPYHAGRGGLRPVAMERTLAPRREEVPALSGGVSPPCDGRGATAWLTAAGSWYLRHLDLLSTVLLALAAVATAWASPTRAAHWRGEQGLAGNRSISAARVEANRAAGVANRQIQIDALVFTQWVDAYSAADARLTPSTSAASGPSSGRRSRRGSQPGRSSTRTHP